MFTFKGQVSSLSEDYHRLGIGTACSIITDIQLRFWGTELRVFCRSWRDDDSPFSYCIVFQDCREFDWVCEDKPDLADLAGPQSLIGIHLGNGSHTEPAVLTASTFELWVLYGRFFVERDVQNSPAAELI